MHWHTKQEVNNLYPSPKYQQWVHWKDTCCSFFSSTYIHSIFSLLGNRIDFNIGLPALYITSQHSRAHPSIIEVAFEISKDQVRQSSTRMEWRGFSSSVQRCTSSNTHERRKEEGQLDFQFSMMKFFSSSLFCMTKVHKMHYVQQRVTVNRHRKAVVPMQFSTFRNKSKLLHNICHCLGVVRNITTTSTWQVCMSHLSQI